MTTSPKELKKFNRRVSIHDVSTNRDIIISVDRFFELFNKHKKNEYKWSVPYYSSPDQQMSLTDPDARSMATSGRGSGVVGYNVQVAVDTEHHLRLLQ